MADVARKSSTATKAIESLRPDRSTHRSDQPTFFIRPLMRVTQSPTRSVRMSGSHSRSATPSPRSFQERFLTACRLRHEGDVRPTDVRCGGQTSISYCCMRHGQHWIDSRRSSKTAAHIPVTPCAVVSAFVILVRLPAVLACERRRATSRSYASSLFQPSSVTVCAATAFNSDGSVLNIAGHVSVMREGVCLSLHGQSLRA